MAGQRSLMFADVCRHQLKLLTVLLIGAERGLQGSDESESCDPGRG